MRISIFLDFNLRNLVEYPSEFARVFMKNKNSKLFWKIENDATKNFWFLVPDPEPSALLKMTSK